MSDRLSYPEIETRTVVRGENIRQHYSNSGFKPPVTLLDLLEISRTSEAVWKEGLDHASIIEHFQGANSRDPGAAPVLRVFFLGLIERRSPDSKVLQHLGVAQCARLHPSTAEWMRDRFDVSPIFLDCLTFGDMVLKTGSISFMKRDKNGKVVNISGFYRTSSGYSGSHTHVWFSHDLSKRSSTYVLDNCPVVAKTLIQRNALGKNPVSLGRPCAIDAFIAENSSQAWGEEMLALRNELIKYEHMRTASQRLSPAEMSAAVEHLHYLSQNLHVISEDITDVQECLDFLSGVHEQYTKNTPDFQETQSVAESLRFLVSRTKIWKRWVMNYKDRTEIRINLFFNLAAQNDNRTNLDIASFTSKIAVDTQRDSSSMITIAAVTMFFLPGTFVSAIFSMVFFNSDKDPDGRSIITTAPQWWYFVAITIPLTIVVFFVWVVWQRWRNRVKGIEHTNNAIEKV